MPRKPKAKPIHPVIRSLLGFKNSWRDREALRKWKERSSVVCKPCWELRYCPYGPVVEQFPLLPPVKSEALAHHEYLKQCLETGKLADGRPIDPERRSFFEEQVAQFDLEQYPEEIPDEISVMQCNVFGHICPVVFVAEPFTETSEGRRTGRYIPFKTKVRVVRRDNYTCQHCGKHLRDYEVEFDHVIPLSRGGSSEEHNLRLTCHDCNADKSDQVQVI